jgi:putative hemolysin
MHDRLLFSYASPDDPALRRVTIRTIERLTGQPRLKRIYLDTQRCPRAGESLFEAAIRNLRLEVDYDPTRLQAIPTAGPVVVVANHPFGVLDGLVIGYLIAKVRPDFKILTHSALYRAPELRPHLLPVDFGATRSATETTLRSRAAALAWLREGGVLVVFPAGAVSTVGAPFAKRAVDAEWRPFTARAIIETRASVLPVFFAGQNSRLFQIASHLSQTLREALLFHEMCNKLGGRVRVRIGEPLDYLDLAHLTDRRGLMLHLRGLTYRLEGEQPCPRRPRRRLRLRLRRRRDPLTPTARRIAGPG